MTVIVEKVTGRLLMAISAPDDVVKLNTPEGCLAVEDPPESNMYYQDGWVAMPAQPTQHHTFDYSTKQWLDPRSLDEIKAQKWAEIKSQRDQLEFGGFEYAGNTYDSDQVSQSRIMGAAVAGVDQTWTLANNTTVDLTGEELKELYTALQIHIAALHERGRIAREKIEVAMIPQDVEAITL